MVVFGSMIATLSAQRPNGNPNPTATITFQQVDELRNRLGLNPKEFDKVYQAYSKYNDAVFGAMQPQRPARPNGNMHRPGNHGGPQGHGPNFGGRPPRGEHHDANPQRHHQMDPKKLEKIKAKQEDKLRKSMKKILKNPHRFDKWLSLRAHQLHQMQHDNHPHKPGNNHH